jgi:hypothetical protein
MALKRLYSSRTPGNLFGPDAERAFTETLGIDVTSISTFLDNAHDSILRLIQGGKAGLEEEIENLLALGVVVTYSPAVLVETAGTPRTGVPGDGEFTQGRYSPRLALLIAGLSRYGIYKEDLTVTVGALRETMMRDEAYVLVEIPKLNKDILVCNQMGEITLVSDRMLGISTYASVNKDDLKSKPGVRAVRFVNEGEWLAAIGQCISEKCAADVRKINVRDYESLRHAVSEEAGMSAEQRCLRMRSSLIACPGLLWGSGRLQLNSGTKENPTKIPKFTCSLGKRSLALTKFSRPGSLKYSVRCQRIRQHPSAVIQDTLWYAR